MKALHLVAYEKFLPHIVEVSEAVNPGQNRFVKLGPTGQLPYDLLSSGSCVILKDQLQLDDEMRAHFDWCEALFLHPLIKRTAAAVEAVKPETVVVWCGMGVDFYNYAQHFRGKLLLPLTRQASNQTVVQRTMETLRTLVSTGRWHRSASPSRGVDPANAVRRVAPRVDIFCAREHGLNLDRTLPGFRAQHVDSFGYYRFERALTMGADPVDGPDILIGNSADWSNNHFDIFEQMRRIDLDGRRIVLPLSYGIDRCADEVEHRAVRLFGRERVLVLRDWFPVSDYNRMLSQCGIVFMNHVRGQAMGNISSMLLRGAKVYLRAENPYTEFFESLGVSFGRIGDAPFDASVFTPLSAEEKARNASILRDYWGWPAVRERSGGLFATVSAEILRRNSAKPLPNGQDSEQAAEG